MPNNSVIHRVGKIVLVVAILGVAAVGIGVWKRNAIIATYTDATKPTPPPVTVVTQPKDTPETPGTKPPVPVADSKLPAQFELSVPFIKQAPFAVWDHEHEETCEEAAVLTEHAYYKKLSLSDQQVDEEYSRVIEIEKKLFGFFEDTNVSKTIQFAKVAYPGMKSLVLENPTLEDLKKEVYAGHPVIVPTNGKLLYNPNYTAGGPVYHMLVLRGWNEKGFFVNDAGTRKGENYFYTYAVVQNAMHDWSEADQLADGPKRALVLYE